MTSFKSAAMTASFKSAVMTASLLAFGLGGITLASSAPFGAAGMGKLDAGSNVIKVDGPGGSGAPPTPGAAPGGTPPAQGQGNKPAGNQAKGGGVPAGKGGTGNNHNGRNGAVAAGVLGGIIGGIIATQPRQAEPVYEEDDEGPRYRCRYGSYIGRDGYRHCRH